MVDKYIYDYANPHFLLSNILDTKHLLQKHRIFLVFWWLGVKVFLSDRASQSPCEKEQEMFMPRWFLAMSILPIMSAQTFTVLHDKQESDLQLFVLELSITVSFDQTAVTSMFSVMADSPFSISLLIFALQQTTHICSVISRHQFAACPWVLSISWTRDTQLCAPTYWWTHNEIVWLCLPSADQFNHNFISVMLALSITSGHLWYHMTTICVSHDHHLCIMWPP